MKSTTYQIQSRWLSAPRRRLFKTLFSTLIGVACVVGWSARATQVLHGISAADVQVIQNDTSNNAASVTLVPKVSINNFHVINGTQTSRADYFVQIGTNSLDTNAADDVTNGILISSITDNGRDNGETNPFAGTIYGTPAVDSGASGNPGSSGQWWVPVFGNATAVADDGTKTYSYTEYNFDFAAAYFPYDKSWYGGWLVNSTGANGGVSDRFIGNTNLILGTNVIPQGKGVTIVDLTQFGLDSRSNAVMLCCGGKNEENFADSKPNPDGTWTITCRDDQSGSAEQDYISFVAIPLANTNVVTGRFAADPSAVVTNGVIEMQNAPFDVAHVSKGTYHLTIPGVTPGHGVLIIAGDEDGPNDADNLVSYQATADGWDIQTRDTGKNQTPNLQDFTGGDTIVDFVYIPAPTANIVVTPTNGLATSQNGGTAAFTVTLDAPPMAELDLDLTSSDPTAGVPSVGTLVFSVTNWDIPQTVTVTGVDNSATSPQFYTIDFAPASSADTNYNGMSVPSVSLANIPNGQPGIFLVPTNGLTTTGAGGTATFAVIMNQQPSSDVTMGFTSSDTTRGGTVSPASVTFNASNWNTPQVVTVTGVDDGVEDGDMAYQITSSLAVSGDPNYNGYNAGNVGVVNLESDVAGVTISSGSSISVPEGYTTNLLVTLSVAPISNVTVGFASSDTSAGTLSPASLTFTPDNWNVPQIVTLTGVANPTNNGNVNYAINITVNSTNPGYSTLVVPALTATTAKAIGLPSGTAIYGLGMPPVSIDGQATASDAIDFDGATLTFATAANADPADTFGVRNDSTGMGISVSGNNISYVGNPIATFAGGSNGSPLVITIGNGVTGDMVTALAEAVTFSTTTANDFANRTIQITLDYGSGGSSTVSKNIRVGLLRIMDFQDGVDNDYGAYNSESDIELEQANPGTPYAAGGDPASGLFVDAAVSGTPNECQVLLRFDDLIGTNINQIPPGSIIVAADLNINVLNTGNGGTLNRMLVPWDGTNATWNSFSDLFGDTGVYADDNTARSEFDSQLGVSIQDPVTGLVTGGGTGLGNVSIGVTPDIQAWANGEANYGWFFHGWNQETDGMGFSPSEDPNPANRPRLRVYWLPTGTPGVSFQNGDANGYTNVQDTEILQSQPDNVVDLTSTIVWSDAADPGSADATEALLRFDNIIGAGPNQIPPGAHIEVAMLNLASINSSDSMGDGGQFFALFQPWQDTNTTWNQWGANGIQNDGVEAATVPTITAGSIGLTPNVQGGFHSFEVTPDVQNWANDTLPDYGWAVVPWPNGSDGWGMDTSEDTTDTSLYGGVGVNPRPQLVVYYTPTSGFVARPTLLPLTISNSQVLVKFSGSIGTTYTVWRADALGGVWVNVGTATVGSDGTATFNDTAPLATAAFYRVSNP